MTNEIAEHSLCRYCERMPPRHHAFCPLIVDPPEGYQPHRATPPSEQPKVKASSAVCSTCNMAENILCSNPFHLKPPLTTGDAGVVNLRDQHTALAKCQRLLRAFASSNQEGILWELSGILDEVKFLVGCAATEQEAAHPLDEECRRLREALKQIAYGDAQTWPNCSSRQLAKLALSQPMKGTDQ